ncbi:glycolate oxidase FAD binding subunit [Burkholderiales bacterium 8X]|nr:glycolate oxidase FAD binding subunit [Burkholderiales bacterium 8X]
MDSAFRQVADCIRAAAADRLPLRIRGGGTKDFYGEPPTGEILSTAGLQGVSSYEPSELVVTVRAGTPLVELEALLAASGQCLAFEAPRFAAGGTVGGMVAAGLSGPARASVGAVRDYVLGATLVNGRGERLGFGGQVMKNVAGYDVSRLLAGSMGVLGVIAEVSLKVLPIAPAEATLRFECSQDDALRLLNGWGGQPLPLNASCWVADGAGGFEPAGSARDLAPPRGGSASDGGVLWLRLRGAVAAVSAACSHLGGERVDEAVARAFWDQLRDMRWAFDRSHALCLWRLSVPQTAPVLAAGTSPLVEWHGGQRWAWAPADEADSMRTAAQKVGGHATLFVAPPALPREISRFDALSPPIRRIHEALAREFDPDGIFDRGRLLEAS